MTRPATGLSTYDPPCTCALREPCVHHPKPEQARAARRAELAETISFELPEGAARMLAAVVERVEHLEAAQLPAAPRLDPETGLLPAEQAVLDLACTLWGAWLVLPVEHPDDARDVAAAVHVVQDRLAMRIARRHFPKGWPVKAAVEGQE